MLDNVLEALLIESAYQLYKYHYIYTYKLFLTSSINP
jgi:hypothetical protein